MMRFFGVLAVLMTIVACQTNAGNPVYVIDAVTPRGQIVPDFTWKQGNTTNTFSQVTKGKIVVLNLWATWCGPCRKEIPDLIELANERKDVMVIGVSVDDANKLSAVVNFVEKNGIQYLSLMDSAKKLSQAFGGITAIPTTFIIKDGVIKQKIVGARSKLQFIEAVNQAM